jgi:DnaJ like chaperone protein
MSWFGKILGLIFGFMFLGPVGALVGILIGHALDKRFMRDYTKSHPFSLFGSLNKTKKLYFYSLFSCIGHLSKVDGRVSESEIKATKHIMRRLKLSEEQSIAAMDAFRTGKDKNFNIHYYLRQLRDKSKGNKNLLRVFMEYLLVAAYADGSLSTRERQLLISVAYSLGISKKEFDDIHRKFKAQKQFEEQFKAQFDQEQSSQNRYDDKEHSQQQNQNNKQNINKPQNQQVTIKNAYTILEVNQHADSATVKRAYRKQMNNYHPDKLVAKGLPDDLMKSATEKAQNIKAAYDMIKQSKGWK